MTKVQITLKLSRALTDAELNEISRMHSVYGLFLTRVLPSGDGIFVEYDASRLSPKEVRGAFEQHGFPLR